MKRIVRILLPGMAIISIAYLCFSILNKIKAKEKIAKQINSLPNFSFKKLDNTNYLNKDITNKNGRIIIEYFNPSCEHCQNMAKMLFEKKDEINQTIILMVTSDQIDNVKQFGFKYHLNAINNVVLLRDPQFQFQKIFGTAFVPSFLIYKNQKLVNKIIGETKFENLFK
jgi:thiol-disulfide isomerase/thioredoxin